MKEKVESDAKMQAYYTLAYAYYLKSFAECTFLAARRQGITLAEDFNTEADSQVYSADFFRTKATTSIQKAKKALWHARDPSGDLMKALESLMTQTH